MATPEPTPSQKPKGRGLGCLKILGILAVVVLATMAGTAWWVKHYVYADQFAPTQLSTEEQASLEAKLTVLGEESAPPPATEATDSDLLQPEAYVEDDERRELSITEKELNALIAKRPKLAERVAVDLADDLLSITLLLPMENDIPIVGGATLRLRLGATIRYQDAQPALIMRGVSVGGVPVPKAWWGEIKDKDLFQEFGGDSGFWDQIAKGVADIQIRDGHLWLKLKE